MKNFQTPNFFFQYKLALTKTYQSCVGYFIPSIFIFFIIYINILFFFHVKIKIIYPFYPLYFYIYMHVYNALFVQ